MTGIRKVVTKAEAVAEAYYISDILSRNPEHSAYGPITGVWHEEHWSGNWKETDYRIWSPDFDVGASRIKHRDGRIRDASSDLENGLAFALFCIEHFPTRGRSLVWAERLLDEKLVRGTLDRRVRRWFVMPAQATFSAVKEAYFEAILLSKVAA